MRQFILAGRAAAAAAGEDLIDHPGGWRTLELHLPERVSLDEWVAMYERDDDNEYETSWGDTPLMWGLNAVLQCRVSPSSCLPNVYRPGSGLGHVYKC